MRPGRIVRQVRGIVQREAHVLLRGGEPTVELLRQIGPDVPADAQVLEVLDLCIQVGEVLLSTGVPAGLSRRGSGRVTQVILLSGIIPLLPGLTAYRGFY